MKRFLKANRYELTDHESETLWYRVRRGVDIEAGSPERPHLLRPARAVAATLAIVALAGTWWIGGQRLVGTLESGSDVNALARHEQSSIRTIEKSGKQGNNESVVVQEPEAPTVRFKADATPDIEDPAADRSAPDEKLETAPAVAMATLSDDVQVTTDTRGVITGRVIDTSNGRPLAFANVLLSGTTRSVVTDSTGTFHFEALAPGHDYALQVMAHSFTPLDVAVALPASGRAAVDCNLEPVVVAALSSHGMINNRTPDGTRDSDRTWTAGSSAQQKYAVDSVAEALSKQSGVVIRSGEPFVRGGRSGEVKMEIDGVVMDSRAPAAMRDTPRRRLAAPGEPGGGSVTGGTTPPNGETFELMYFQHTGVNPFVSSDEDALSTFALDVDNASFTLARSYLDRGILPPRDAVRVEEFVNALDAGWPSQDEADFRLHTDAGKSRFGGGYHLLRIGVVGRSVDRQQRKPANLVFVIDISGSMNRESRLGAVKRALRTLVDALGEGDRVGIVVYGSRGEVRLPLTDLHRRETILAAIEALQPGGSTNAAEGLQLAYRIAREGYDAGAVNRLILCSDGVANTGGATDAEGILRLVRRATDEGVTLSTVGFGMGNYNDVLMEKLADQGDGNYFYVDRPAEAERVFRENLTGLLQTIARETKVQVEFDPRVVSRWRLLGYENRDVADRDFRNDAVDAGEVGAGHQVTALYEVKLASDPRLRTVANIADVDSRDDAAPALPAATVRLRWEAPAHDAARAGQVNEIEHAVPLSAFGAPDATGSPQRLAQILAAEFAEILRGSYWARESRLSDLVPLAAAVAERLPDNAAVQDLERMIRRATDLQGSPSVIETEKTWD